MGISKIGNLFAANVDSLGANQQAKQVQAQATSAPVAAATPVSSEAAVFSFAQNRAPQGDTEKSNREARVKELKTLVSRGEYKPSSQDLAVSVIRDLA